MLFSMYNKPHKDTFNENVKSIEDSLVKDQLVKEIKRHNNKHIAIINTLNIAYTYLNTPFYMPIHIDFRGRVYTMVSDFTFQGSAYCTFPD